MAAKRARSLAGLEPQVARRRLADGGLQRHIHQLALEALEIQRMPQRTINAGRRDFESIVIDVLDRQHPRQLIGVRVFLVHDLLQSPPPFAAFSTKGGHTLPVFAITPAHIETGTIDPIALDWARKAGFKAEEVQVFAHGNKGTRHTIWIAEKLKG